MREQFSSTTSIGASIGSQADQPSARQVGNFALSSRSRRIGAAVVGCAVLGFSPCRHALAQQDAPGEFLEIGSSDASPSALSDALTALTDRPQLEPNQARALQHFDWIAFRSESTDRADSAQATHTSSQAVTHEVVVTTTTEHRLSSLAYRRIYRMSRAASLGQTSVAHQGKPGILERTYQVTYRADVPVSYHYVGRRVVKAPVDMIIDAGYTDRAARALPSRSGLYTRAREIDMIATGYSPMEGSGSGRCANGMRAGYGVVAVDPRLIPLGSKLFVTGYGYAFAGDTGGAIKGRRIDLGQNTYHAASMVGRRKVQVYVLSDAYSR